ncbi:glycosyltransferase [Winogradskyella bathintestinalis]|uniref:Glycosyltransferase n=1 Tax=Winogradskyella bathintestinalis TaxID=3035208 RepID=A0ABT7ZXN2_9FLAO|nr:glycosyltransferase [Winogradskyella bathintestinalis]MDN3493739.1 glycosyltransferase [Winogradskyella bathintestinalis]
MSPNSKQNISILCISLGSGGAEKVISLLLKKLISDYNVTLVMFYDVIHFPVPKEAKIVVLSNKGIDRSFFPKITDAFKFIIQYYRFVKTNNITISISFLAFPNLINGMISMLTKNVKTIISERGFPSDNVTSKLSFYISKVFYPIFYNRCDALFSNSVHINRDLKENFDVNIPMEVIYNPIEIPGQTIDSSTLIRPFNALNIITAGTLNKRKNQIMVVRALKASSLKYKFLILGAGELQGYLQEEIRNFQLNDSIFLKGKVKNVNDYLLNSQCFVLSSFTEGFPNALIEAMAIGLPSISTNCLSGPLELLNENKEINIEDGEYFIGKYGLLVNNDDHIGLSKALDYFHSNPEERVRFSILGVQRAKEYRLDSIYTKFNHFIQN